MDRDQIHSHRFVSGSPLSIPDLMPYFCFGFSGITLGFDLFILFQVLRHRARIRSLSLVSGSLDLLLDLIPSFFFLGSPASCQYSIPSF